MDEQLSKTVRIDLMPGHSAEPSALERNALLKKANYSTRRRQAAMADEQSRSRYEELLESVYDAAVITSPTGKIIEVNGRAVEFLGYEKSMLCSMSMTDVIDGATEDVMRNISQTLLNERFALLQAFCIREDGSMFPAEIAVNRLSMDNVRLCFFIRDVTVRYETEAFMRAEHLAVQTCTSGVAICESDGTLQFVNPAFAEMTGYSEPDLPGYNIVDAMGRSEAVESLLNSALSSDETWVSELLFESGDGRNVFVHMSATCTRDEEGRAAGVVFTLTDLTTQQQMQQAIAEHRDELAARSGARTSDLLDKQNEYEIRIQMLEKQLAEAGIESI